ncbi:MAG TPA: sigma factor [Micromonosporaceae bacterium]|nr:sigma factor [Micromonosporaceae bacterium]
MVPGIVSSRARRVGPAAAEPVPRRPVTTLASGPPAAARRIQLPALFTAPEPSGLRVRRDICCQSSSAPGSPQPRCGYRPTTGDRGDDDGTGGRAHRARGKGDADATATLLTAVWPGAVRYCRVRLGWISGGHATADDVSQEVCLAILRALPRFRDQGRPFAAFAYRIAANKVADAQRAARRDPAATPLDTWPSWSSVSRSPSCILCPRCCGRS